MSEIRVKSTGTIKLFESDNTSSVTIASPASLSANRTITIPDADVTLGAGTTINTNGNDRLITGSGTPNTLTGETNLTYNGTILGVGASADLGAGVHIKVSDTGASVNSSADELIIERSGDNGMTFLNSVSGESFINFGDSGDNDIGQMSYHHSYNRMDFSTNGSRRMRMNSNGTIEIKGGTGRASTLQIMDDTGTGYEALSVGTVNTGNATVIAFRNPNGTVGYINTNGTATAYLTSSDYRLKENVSYEFDATTRLKQLKPARFNFIADADTTVDGFIAHEVSSIVPEAISGEKDALEKYRNADETPEGKSVGDNKLDENGDTIIHAQSIDQSKLVPLLVKTIQELEARITALENA